MSARIDYFFTPISGFAYLGHAALLRLAAGHDARVVLRPMDTLAVFAAIGVTPPPSQPAARLRYRQADMRRWAACRRLPLVTAPKFWPTDATLAARSIIVAEVLGGDAGRLAGALLEAVWARELDIADPATVGGLARSCGCDPDAVLEGARSEGSAAAYAANTAEAIERGVLGSPSFLLGDEMFFGQDRLGFLGEALADAPAA